MNTIDIVAVFAIILFARLGIRLVMRYNKMKKEKDQNEDSNPQKDLED